MSLFSHAGHKSTLFLNNICKTLKKSVSLNSEQYNYLEINLKITYKKIKSPVGATTPLSRLPLLLQAADFFVNSIIPKRLRVDKSF